MKFETIKNKKYFLYVLIIGIILFITFIVSTSLAKYKLTESIKIASGNITYSPSDLNIVSIYIKEEGATNYTNIDTIPESGYKLNNEASYNLLKKGLSDSNITFKLFTFFKFISNSFNAFMKFNIKSMEYFEQLLT